MAYLSPHKSCCGIQHIMGHSEGGLNGDYTRYGYPTAEELDRMTIVKNILYEITLTNKQCRENPEYIALIQRKGFRLVTTFKNPNSGNICNVFHYSSNMNARRRPPFKVVKD